MKYTIFTLALFIMGYATAQYDDDIIKRLKRIERTIQRENEISHNTNGYRSIFFRNKKSGMDVISTNSLDIIKNIERLYDIPEYFPTTNDFDKAVTKVVNAQMNCATGKTQKVVVRGYRTLTNRNGNEKEYTIPFQPKEHIDNETILTLRAAGVECVVTTVPNKSVDIMERGNYHRYNRFTLVIHDKNSPFLE